jgi:hypothetical protein
MPMGRGLMVINREITPTLFVTNAAGYYCTSGSIILSAHINAGVPGSLQFYLWTNNTNYTSYGSSSIDSSGNASVTINPGILSSNTYYIQAVYAGSGFYAPVSTPSGTGGVQIIVTNSIPTTTSITPNFIQPICPYSNATFTLTASAVGGEEPTSGSFQIYIYDGFSYYPATITGGVLSGSNSTTATITGITNPSLQRYQWFYGSGTNYIHAVYSGDGTCFAGSTSSPDTTITTYLNTMSISAPLQNGALPVNFCRADGGSDTWSVTLTFSNGSATGTVDLYSSLSSTPVATNSGTYTSGLSINFVVAHSTWSDGLQSAFAIFTPTVTTNCYGRTIGTSSGNFTVYDAASQVPSVSMQVSTDNATWGSNISTEYGVTTIYCQVTVNKTGLIGNDSSTISLWAGTINGGPYSSNVTANTTYFPSGPPVFTDSGSNTTTITFSFSCNYFGDVNQTFYMIGTYNGTPCFGTSNSGQVIINQSQLIQ